MRKIDYCLLNCCKKSMKNILLMDTIGLQTTYFKKLVGCFRIIWHISAAKLLEYAQRPENTGTNHLVKKALNFPTKYRAIGMQQHLCRSLFLT